MELLKNRILKDGVVLKGNILKVDSFLNHQMDPSLMAAIGEEFAHRFSSDAITKILTIEASGIAPALFAGYFLKVPVIFAKKTESSNIDASTFAAPVHSYTRDTDNYIRVSSRYLASTDHVLIIDDFLAHGEALLGLADLVRQAGATVAGAGIVIEKGFQSGGQRVRSTGIRVESLAIIKDMSEGRVEFT
ncbi:MAG: xanthine phosphoribosyltransferase [Eubacteriales bacterium]|nr:xanthine phosphoribosyltransferase [Eubacteriales bacterium]